MFNKTKFVHNYIKIVVLLLYA